MPRLPFPHASDAWRDEIIAIFLASYILYYDAERNAAITEIFHYTHHMPANAASTMTLILPFIAVWWRILFVMPPESTRQHACQYHYMTAIYALFWTYAGARWASSFIMRALEDSASDITRFSRATALPALLK